MKDRLMEPVGLRERTACLFCMSQSLFENSFPPSARPTLQDAPLTESRFQTHPGVNKMIHDTGYQLIYARQHQIG